ncbi:DUF3987 domain-containing protein [Streptomyces sp. NPDC058440]|uniref:DUF3987 domain-containing protein n=1 Tax=Streptomyces sp. NPDC058440 TaxID=3346501 RepID=UPI00365BA7CA
MRTFEEMAYGPLGEAVNGLMPTSEADPIGVWAASLSLYSAAISRTVRLDNRRPVVIWTVLAGRSAIGRKGYALGSATELLRDAIGGFIYTRKRSGVANGPSLVDMLSKMESENTGPDGGHDGRCVLVEEEWASVLKDQKKCSKFSTYFRTAWDGKPVSNRTKKEGLQSVAQPLLGFHSHITPGEWAKYVSSSEALGGSYNRLLPVLVERSKLLPYNNKWVIPETSELKRAYEWAQEEKRVMCFSKEAGERYDEIRAIVEDKMAELPELLASYMERTAEQVHRVAAVLSALDMTEEISIEAVNAAWAFVEYSTYSVEKLVKDAASDGGGAKPMKTPEELIDEVLDKHDGKVSSSIMLRALWGKLKAAEIKAVVEGMDTVELVREKGEGRGAPSQMYVRVEPPEPSRKFKVIKGEGQAPEPKPEPKRQPPQASNGNPFQGLI